MTRSAFSLIEITVVLMILSIIAGAVALGVAAQHGRAGLEQVSNDLVAFDGQCRTFARQSGQELRVRVDLGEGRLDRADIQGRPTGTSLVLPEGVRLGKLLLADEAVTDGGKVVLTYNRLGLSPSYAMQVEAKGAAPRWLLFCGATGYPVQVKDETEAKTILSAEATAASKTSGDDAR